MGFDLTRVFGNAAIGLTHKDIEVKDRAGVLKKIAEIKPDVVINTAAIVKLEWCELNKEACYAVNAAGAGNVAEATALVGATSVQISTDYVFDGSKDGFSEHDQPNPLNVYGTSKLEGERLVQEKNPQHYVVRSSWFFGVNLPHKGLDFPRTMLELARANKEIRVVNDQFGSPTHTKDLALKIKEIIDKGAPYGIYHVTNSGSCSWYQLAQEVFKIRKITATLVPIKSEFNNSKARRPLNSVLVNSNLKSAGIDQLRGWQDALKDYLQEIN